MSNNCRRKRVWCTPLAIERWNIAIYTLTALSLLMMTMISACQPAILDPPRLATQTAEVIAPPLPSRTPIISDAPTPTAQPINAYDGDITAERDLASDRITLWVNETSPDHAATLEEMVLQFTAEEQILVEVLLVSPQLLPELVQQAVISDTLPDLIVHPITYSAGWVEQGILDADLALESVQDIGENTFDPAALEAVQTANGSLAAIPSDGWRQLLIYRADWFSDHDLAPPDNYDRLLIAAETLYEPEGSTTGIVVPTDASLVSTQQIFEYLAIANGCELVEPDGRVALLHPACLEALEYYRELINGYSPIGFQTDISSLNAYLAGRTGMIITTPAVLPYLAGLDDSNTPSCPDCLGHDYLAKNSGFVTRLNGGEPSEIASSYSELTALGITSGENREAALAFANFWFNEGYSRWLAVNPERKVPLRWGTQDQPGLYIDSWGNSPLAQDGPTIEELFGIDLVDQLTNNIAASNRWGFAEGQSILVGTMYQDLLIAPLLQDMLSGYFTSSQTIIELYQVMVNSIPNYSFPVEIAPTPTP